MKTENSLAEHLRQLEERLLRPEIRRSRLELEALLAREFREFGSSGRTYDREQIVDALLKQAPHELSLHEFQIQALAADAVLATYRATARAISSDAEAHSWRSSIWVKEDEQWKVLFHQGTPAPSLPASGLGPG